MKINVLIWNKLSLVEKNNLIKDAVLENSLKFLPFKDKKILGQKIS